MKLYHFLKVIGFGCLISGSALLLFVFVYAPTASVAAPDTALAATPVQGVPAIPASMAPGVPVAIMAPEISLDVPVIPVDVTQENAVDVPNTLKLSGWFDRSSLPGNPGSSLIDGHVGNSVGTPGVFANLHKLQVGDDIYVKDRNGNSEHFVVTATHVYPLADVPMSAILAKTDESRLNIITCAGAWVPSAKTFDHRLVVYTKLVSDAE